MRSSLLMRLSSSAFAREGNGDVCSSLFINSIRQKYAAFLPSEVRTEAIKVRARGRILQSILVRFSIPKQLQAVLPPGQDALVFQVLV